MMIALHTIPMVVLEFIYDGVSSKQFTRHQLAFIKTYLMSRSVYIRFAESDWCALITKAGFVMRLLKLYNLPKGSTKYSKYANCSDFPIGIPVSNVDINTTREFCAKLKIPISERLTIK